MSYLEKALSGIAVIALVFAVGFLVSNHNVSRGTLGDAGYPLYMTSMTNTSVAVSSATSTTLLTASSGRVYAIFGNSGTSTQTVYITLGPNASQTSGITLPSGASYVINAFNQYVGLITAISSSGTSTITMSYSQ